MAYRTHEEIRAEIRRLARERGVSEAELAGALGISADAVRRTLRGERGLVAAELAGIADALGVRPGQLLRDDADGPARGADTPEGRKALAQVDELIENYLYFKALVP